MSKKLTLDDLLNLEGNKVPTDARSYSTLIYGQGKAGKTTFINDLYGERVLFLATERRHAHIEGVHVINIDSYSDFLRVMRVLRDPQAKEKYDALCLDTTGRLEMFIEQYVLNKLNIDALGDLPYGAGYGEYNRELENAVTLLEKSGYIPHFISHDKPETVKVEKSKATNEEKSIDGAEVTKDKKTGKEYIEYERRVPDIKNKLNNLLARVVDNVLYLGYVVDENGVEERRIFTQPTATHFAGVSFSMPDSIEQSADAYLKAMEDAIKNKDKDDVQEGGRKQSKGTDFDFKELMGEVARLGKDLQDKGKTNVLTQTVEDVLGKGKKVKDLQPNQAELLSVLVDRLKEVEQD